MTAYIPYTRRLAIVEEFTPEEAEDRLYDLVSEYLRRDNLKALPASQRSLMTLVLRKLLASSTFAIAGALESIARRLRAEIAEKGEDAPPGLEEDYEAFDATSEEWEEEAEREPLTDADRLAIAAEIAHLDNFARLARSIDHNAKGRALIKALNIAFAKAAGLGARQKAIIFTESRRTQAYLLRVLADSAYAEGIVLFNGTNTDPRSKEIYAAWRARHEGTDRVSGSRSADMRSALVDYFRDEGRIMIATEAGAEGINLQFCSLVVNYDLPWNPQRIEQRIGRCHRYGQKHDVVVVNFLNRKNEADQRVFTLLNEKFQLFEGVFGASDEVLGAIESGVDFEKRIAAIYQQCRRTKEIREAFDSLQLELSLEINQAMSQTRRKLLDNFDDEVREKLRMRDEAAKAGLGRFERQLMAITRHELDGSADFAGDASFHLKAHPPWMESREVPLGLYELPRRSGEAHFYRLQHPLGEAVVERARSRSLPPAEVRFDYESHDGKISQIEALAGQSGWLEASMLTIEALDQPEDRIVVVALADSGAAIPDEVATRMLGLPATAGIAALLPAGAGAELAAGLTERQSGIQTEISERNGRFFEEEAAKLDGWADDLKVGLEREIKEIDRQIKEARRAATAAASLEQKLVAQKQIKALEATRNQRRRSLFDAQDRIDRERAELIGGIEARLKQTIVTQPLFTIRWTIV